MKPVLRRVAYTLLARTRLVVESAYEAADNIPGYQGYVQLAGGTCLAFRRDDGTLQFSW